MSRNIFPDMVTYYANLAGQLTSEAKQAGILENPSAVGTDREEIYRKFLKRHIPYMCDVFRGGSLFDVDGNASKQIDLIVTSGMSPRFEMREGSHANAPIEGTIAAVEVKSMLDKAKLYEALENFAAIPRLRNPEDALSPIIKAPSEAYWWDWPYKVIFAYNGIDRHRLYEHFAEFYSENGDIPQECRPSMIHVLDSYVILRIVPGLGTMAMDGSMAASQPAIGDYRGYYRKPDISAMVVLFAALQRNAFIAHHMIWDYSRWVHNVALEVLRKYYPGEAQ